MTNQHDMRNCILGSDTIIEPNVILGYTYLNAKEPVRIGSHTHIHSGTVIYADTLIGSHFTAGHNVTVRAHCKIGDRVVILHGSTLEGNIVIGKGVKIMAHVYLPSQTEIGDMVFIGPGVNVLNARIPMRVNGLNGVRIGEHSVIGGGVTLLPGISIGRNCVIGAGAVVTKDVPDNTLSFGNPARNTPMPTEFGTINDPEQIFRGRDLWNNQPDDSWEEEEFPGKELWQTLRNKK